MIRQLFRRQFRVAFRTRSPDRDASADRDAIGSIATAIEAAIENAEAERTGLERRLEDVISVAAIVGGNDATDYLDRDDVQSKMLSDSDAEIRAAQSRLDVLEQNVSNLKFLRSTLQTRFNGTIGTHQRFQSWRSYQEIPAASRSLERQQFLNFARGEEAPGSR